MLITVKTVYHRVCRTLLHEDHIAFALRLAQVRLKGTPDELDEEEVDFVLRGGDGLKSNPNVVSGLIGCF